jgi:hypothetical protein
MTNTTPYDSHPHVADVEVAEKRFHVRQHRRMALSASSDVAGTWKCFSTASSSATCSPITPLCHHTTHFTPEAHKVRKCAGGQKPPAIICIFKPPSHSTVHGTNKGDHQGIYDTKIRCKNATTPPTLPKSASALPGDVGDRSGAIMHPISTAHTPREF